MLKADVRLYIKCFVFVIGIYEYVWSGPFIISLLTCGQLHRLIIKVSVNIAENLPTASYKYL